MHTHHQYAKEARDYNSEHFQNNIDCSGEDQSFVASLHYKTKNLVWVSFDLLRSRMVCDYSGKLSCM